eukprot:TRINITY_DN55254_c0_g1_i1.p1 TRINITY_DN55254_c0_g1~~TRINITY_DN55254_c0_g1_i1.p1  ORF type:complete len:151 (+),score=40.34 TRINITY_DN55254_c0_g1_i1:81-533(+)
MGARLFLVTCVLQVLLAHDLAWASRVKRVVNDEDKALEAMSKEELIEQVRSLSQNIQALEQTIEEVSSNDAIVAAGTKEVEAATSTGKQNPKRPSFAERVRRRWNKEVHEKCWCDGAEVMGGVLCKTLCSCRMKFMGVVDMKGLLCPGGE